MEHTSASDRKPLQSIMDALIAHWGEQAVRRSIESASGRAGKRQPPIRAREKSRKARPTEMVNSARIPPIRREEIRILAQKFEEKSFLPSTGAIRELFLMHHIDPGPLKNRDDSFRKVLKFFSELNDEEFSNIRARAAQFEPTRLAPIADAIAVRSNDRFEARP